MWANAGLANIHAIYENFSNDGIMFFIDSKIGEEQSAEDAEDGPPELLVYIGFLMQIEMSMQTGLFVIDPCIWKRSQFQMLALGEDLKSEVL